MYRVNTLAILKDIFTQAWLKESLKPAMVGCTLGTLRKHLWRLFGFCQENLAPYPLSEECQNLSTHTSLGIEKIWVNHNFFKPLYMSSMALLRIPTSLVTLNSKYFTRLFPGKSNKTSCQFGSEWLFVLIM